MKLNIWETIGALVLSTLAGALMFLVCFGLIQLVKPNNKTIEEIKQERYKACIRVANFSEVSKCKDFIELPVISNGLLQPNE